MVDQPSDETDVDAMELARLRRDGDPRISPETKAAIRALTQQDWEEHGRLVDELTKGDFDELNADL